MILAEIADKLPGTVSMLALGVALALLALLLGLKRFTLALLPIAILLVINLGYFGLMSDSIDGNTLGTIMGGAFVSKQLLALNLPMVGALVGFLSIRRFGRGTAP